MATTDLTAANFAETIEGNDIVLIDWWAAWCGPCRMFAPVFEKASEEHPDIVFGKIDTEAEQSLAAQAQISSIPTLMAFRDGILLYAQPGALPAPALANFANSSPLPFVNGIKMARERIVARTDEDRTDFLRRRGFSKAETGKIIDAVLTEEGRPPESIFDFVQGITAVARDKPHQDARLDMEAKAKKLLDRAA